VKNFALPLLLFGLLYVFFILPQSRRRKQALALQRAVEPGSRVMLTSGLFGTVVDIDDEAVIVEAAEGIRLRYAKAAVLRVIPDAVDEADDDDADIDDADADTVFDETQFDDADFGDPEPGDAGVDDTQLADIHGSDVSAESGVEVKPSDGPDQSTEGSSGGSPKLPKHDGHDGGSGPVPNA
jgi:preprotein translocase subunit YajC